MIHEYVNNPKTPDSNRCPGSEPQEGFPYVGLLVLCVGRLLVGTFRIQARMDKALKIMWHSPNYNLNCYGFCMGSCRLASRYQAFSMSVLLLLPLAVRASSQRASFVVSSSLARDPIPPKLMLEVGSLGVQVCSVKPPRSHDREHSRRGKPKSLIRRIGDYRTTRRL